MKTLLDHRSATLADTLADTWFQAHFVSMTATSRLHYYLTVVTLLDQLDLKEVNWLQVSVILKHQSIPDELLRLFGGVTLKIGFIRVVSKILVDPNRAGSLWANSYKYAGLATYILQFLRDE
jgi:hypothetical protein